MGLEREEGGSAVQSQFSPRDPQLTQALPQAHQPQPLLAVEAAPPAEQVAIATGTQQLNDRRFERRTAVVQESASERRLGAPQLRQRRTLLGARKAKVRTARGGEPSYFGGASAERAAAEGPRHHQRIEQRVALKHVPVEVGQRRDLGHFGIVLLGDERQPQAQLGEAHGCRRQVDAEQ